MFCQVGGVSYSDQGLSSWSEQKEHDDCEGRELCFDQRLSCNTRDTHRLYYMLKPAGI